MAKLTFLKKTNFLLLLFLLLALFLRFFHLDSFPPLYSDEASLGYNAYSILKTGRDEYGQWFPVLLRSFGDYKPALSAYLATPVIALFGLNEYAVRFPSALLGTLTVLLTYFLTQEIFRKNNYLAIIAALSLAISPWHIHLSRMTMLVGIEAFFTTLGIYLFLRGIREIGERRGFLILSAMSFTLTFYAYYGARVTTSLVLLTLFLLYYKELLKRKKEVFLAGFFALLLLSPLLITFIKNPEVITARVKWVSLFRYPEVKNQLWQATVIDSDMHPLLVKFFHNKPMSYSKDILRRYLQHFSPNFLLFKGDKASPFKIWEMGVFYLTLYPFLLFGLLFLTKKLTREQKVCFFWLLIAPIPACLTAHTPAANRTFEMVVPLQIITALGIWEVFKKLKKRRYFRQGLILFVLLLFFNFCYFLKQYVYVTLRKIPREFYDGQKELVNFVKENKNPYEKIVISSKTTMYVFFLFYEKYSPEVYLEESKKMAPITEAGFQFVESFGKFLFRSNFDWETEEKKQGVLYIAFPTEIPGKSSHGFNTLKEIFYPNGKIGIRIVDL